jgi:toxin secretion/phage lysis holin
MKKMEQTTYVKAVLTGIFAVLTSFLGILTVPVLLMVGCNIIDYVTGLMASKYRKEDINSYKSIRGIFKKVCMWILVVVGAIIDQLIIYAANTVGYSIPFTFLVACVVAIWITCNELISILENIQDMGVNVPGFLKPLIKNIRSKVENKVDADDTESE